MDRIIDDESRKYLKDKFESLTDEVDINVYYDDDNDEARDYVEFTKKFASEIADISDKIKLSLVQSKIGSQTKSGMTIRTNPSITIGEDRGYKILFSGSPLGYEASQIVETIVMVSTGNHEFDENIANELKSVSKDVHIKVFVTPTCPYCPGSAYLANRVAVASGGKVLSETIEANENPDLAVQWGIESVPTQIINDDEQSITIGLQGENEFVNLVLSYGK
ncbi:MAG: thioredoxin family protein [Spirochaetia bacterium]|nr:thioredoxin family protein [Spirochaetota bacterium]MCX8096319.1 thioredoxin family protein [Spirochaetota bacterium]MDW8112320.1 thioredoxin family protein [Spirochaetia bacterium]